MNERGRRVVFWLEMILRIILVIVICVLAWQNGGLRRQLARWEKGSECTSAILNLAMDCGKGGVAFSDDGSVYCVNGAILPSKEYLPSIGRCCYPQTLVRR